MGPPGTSRRSSGGATWGRTPRWRWTAATGPYIAYQRQIPATHGQLRVAHFDGSSWITETVDGDGEVGAYSAIQLDGSDRPYVSYYDKTQQDLKLAHYDGISWTIEVVDSAGSVGSYTALALDAAGRPHIAYYDASSGTVKYASYDGRGLVDQHRGRQRQASAGTTPWSSTRPATHTSPTTSSPRATCATPTPRTAAAPGRS